MAPSDKFGALVPFMVGRDFCSCIGMGYLTITHLEIRWSNFDLMCVQVRRICSIFLVFILNHVVFTFMLLFFSPQVSVFERILCRVGKNMIII